MTNPPLPEPDEPIVYRKTFLNTLRLFFKGLLMGLPAGFPPDFTVRYERRQTHVTTGEGWFEKVNITCNGGTLSIGTHETGTKTLQFPVTRRAAKDLYRLIRSANLNAVEPQWYFYSSPAPKAEEVSMVAWNELNYARWGTGFNLSEQDGERVWMVTAAIGSIHGYNVVNGILKD